MIDKLNKITRYLERVPCDKRLHFMIGTLIVSFLILFNLSIFLIVSILVVISWSIEFYQKFTKSGTYDNWDATAVVAGGLVVGISHALQGSL